jgi:hypothetical protein
MYATGIMAPGAQGSSHGRPDRYETLPGLAGMPAWIWGRLPRAGRIAIALLPVAVVALVLLLAPGIDDSKDERARAEAERLEQFRAQYVERLRAEQRPRFRRGAPAGTDLERRAALAGALSAAVGEDARARVAAGELDGPIVSVRCEGFPPSADRPAPHLQRDRKTGSYSCLAVTSEVEPTERTEAASIGHPYRALVNFDTGRYALCKVSGRAGEGSIGRMPFVPPPAACGGT